MAHYDTVRDYLNEIDLVIKSEDPENEIFVVEEEESGIKDLMIVCADPILVLEQHLFSVENPSQELFESLLMKNREIIAGAFVLDDTGKKVIYRDTLQLENLDLNELEGTINSLELLLTEYTDTMIKFSKQ